MENVGMFFDHLEYFWYDLWTFGIICGHLVYFSRFGMFGPRKIWQPWITHCQRSLAGSFLLAETG
jgi:hypothetical protein